MTTVDHGQWTVHKNEFKVEENEKLYYTIGEVAARFGVNVSLIRFWTNEFSRFLKPKTNKKGNRMYTVQDIEVIARIYDLVKVRGFTLSGAKDELNKKSDIQDTKKEQITKLLQLKQWLIEERNKLKTLH